MNGIKTSAILAGLGFGCACGAALTAAVCTLFADRFRSDDAFFRASRAVTYLVIASGILTSASLCAQMAGR